MTTPAGLPLITRTASIEYYGGHADKANYLGQGAVDARTDVTAEQIKRLSADLTAIARVAPAAVIRYANRDATTDDPLVSYCRLASGVTGQYDGATPPSGFPTLARVSDGVVNITFPTTLSDDYGVSAKVHIIGGIGGIVASSLVGDVTVDPSDPNSDGYYERIQVVVADDGGAVADAEVLLEIWT